MNRGEKQVEAEEIAALVKEAELEGIFLTELRARFFEKKVAELPLKSSVLHEVLSVERAAGSFSANMGLVFKGLDRRGRKIAEIRIVYSVRYRCESSFPDEVIREFLDTSAVVQLWPLFRKHLLELTTEMGLPPFVLPLLKFLPP